MLVRPFLLVIASLVLFLPGFWTLPPQDRDEPRFAQASKQMLETGDFVSIRFGEEARNKKPVGIHWLQAASVRAAETVGVREARRRIWIYRLPSLLGAVAAVLLTFWAALPMVSRSGAMTAALLVAATPLLGAEARLATTDAVLLATVTGAMGALARLYLAAPAARARAAGAAATGFWVAVAAGLLVKGPITPMIAGLAAIVLSIRERSLVWLRALRPLVGLVLCLVVVLPWFVLILFRTHGTFFTEAVGHDLLGKVAGGQERHGAPPGFYFAAFWLTGWPLAPFAALAAPSVWRHRREPAVIVLLAWIVPAWVVFEAVPTKLVHYALPLYPALAILAVFGLERALAELRNFRGFAGGVLVALLVLVPVVVLALVIYGSGWLWHLSVLDWVGAVAAIAASVALAVLARRALVDADLPGAGRWAALSALPIVLLVFGRVLSPAVSPALAVSPRLAAAAAAALGGTCAQPLYVTVGDREPSLVFTTSGDILMTDAVGAARFMSEGDCRVAFVDARDEAAFKDGLDESGSTHEAARVEGFAVNGGHPLDIAVYVRKGVAP